MFGDQVHAMNVRFLRPFFRICLCLEVAPTGRSRPHLPVQRAVTDGFQHVVGADFVVPAEIGQSTRHFENAVVGSGAEIHLAHGVFEAASGLGIEFAVLFDESRRHAAVVVNARMFGEALLLHAACSHDTLADGLGGFTALTRSQRLVIYEWHIHVKVDTIKQGPADALTITLNDRRPATALALEVAVVPTWAWLRCLFSGPQSGHPYIALAPTRSR